MEKGALFLENEISVNIYNELYSQFAVNMSWMTFVSVGMDVLDSSLFDKKSIV